MADSFRRATIEDSNNLFQWRNNPLVRQNMYTYHEITKNEHDEWLTKTLNDQTKQYFIFEDDDGPQSVVGFTDINNDSGTASWFFYSGNLEKRGLGSKMEKWALNYAFNELKLNKLCCEVLSFNMPVVRFHQKHGFDVEGILKEQYKRDDKYYDIYKLGLHKKTYLKWLSNSDIFKVGKSYEEDFQITLDDISNFAKLTGDNNPIHLDKDFAIANGFKENIAHGFLVSSVFSKILGTKFPGHGTIYMSQTLEFKAPVFPNEKLKVILKVSSKAGRKALLTTQIFNDQEHVVVTGEAKVLLRKDLN